MFILINAVNSYSQVLDFQKRKHFSIFYVKRKKQQIISSNSEVDNKKFFVPFRISGLKKRSIFPIVAALASQKAV